MKVILLLALLVVIAVVLLHGSDRIAGHGPKQVKDGINRSKIGRSNADRALCPYCAELILHTAKKCLFYR